VLLSCLFSWLEELKRSWQTTKKKIEWALQRKSKNAKFVGCKIRKLGKKLEKQKKTNDRT